MKIKNISIKKRKEMIAVVFLILILILGVFFVFAQTGVSTKTKCEYSSECALSSSEVEDSKSETLVCGECNKCNPLSVGCIPNIFDNRKACGESSNYMCLNGECIPKENCYCNYLSQITGKEYVPCEENSDNPIYSQASGTAGTGSGITPITAAAVKSITGFAAAESTKEIMIMVFVADSCPPCERIIKSSVLQQIDNYMIPGFDKKVKVQIYHQKNHQTFFRQYGVKMTPTTIILNNGKLIVDNQGNPFSKIGEYAPSNLYDINNKEKMREYIRQSLVYIQNIVDPLLREVEVINEAGTEITIECEKNGENKNNVTIKNPEQYTSTFKISSDSSLKISPYSFFTLNSGNSGSFEVKYLGECPKEEKNITITSLRGPFTKESQDSMGSPRYVAKIKVKIIPKKPKEDVNCVAGKETIIERYCAGNAVHEKFSVQEGVMCILKSRKIIDCTSDEVCKESVKDGKKDASCVKKGEETPGDEWELTSDGKPGSEEEKPLPTPGPEPTPTPTPEPTPTPQPEPSPSPEPEPTPQPMPQPTPSPEPTPSPTPSPSPSSGEEKAACCQEKPKEPKPGQLSTPPKKQEFVSVLSNPKYSDGGEGSASGEDKGYKTANANLFLEKNAFKEILEKSNTIGDFYKNILSSNIPMAITANIVFGTGGTWGESWKGNLKTKDIYDSFIEQYNDLAFASQGKYRKTKKSGYENMPQNLKDHNKNLYPLTRNDYDNFAGLLNSVLSKTGEFPPGTQITIVTGPCNPYVEIKVPGKTPIKQAIAQGQIESFFKFYYNSIMVRDPSPSGLRRDDGAVESTIDRLFRNKQNYLNQLSK